MSTATATEYTPEDLLTMPDGNRYELVDGQLLEKPLGAKADWVGMRLLRLIGDFIDSLRLGEVFGPASGDRRFPNEPRKVRNPDGSVILAGRLPGGRCRVGELFPTSESVFP